MADPVSAKMIRQFGVRSAPGRKDVVLLSVVLANETAYYGVPSENLRDFANVLMQAAEKLEGQEVKPN